ncbi:MAG: DUF2341 domain-containing protein [Candidatus Shapirobacteria bacterium]|jgi:hypothetical protein
MSVSRRVESFSLKTLLIIVVILLVSIIALLRINQKPDKVSASWFNDGWQYRKSINISSHTSAESNVYVTITTDTSDTSRFQTDCGDIRFTKTNGELLPYYLATACGVGTSIHVNFDSLPAGASTFYLYYGNPSTPNGFSASDFSTAASNFSLGSNGTEEVSSAPVAHWSFDEGVGTTAHDSSVNANHGTFGSGSSAPSWTTEDMCVSGKCLKFDGNDYLAMGNKLIFTSSQPLTISTWFKINSFASRNPLVSRTNTAFSRQDYSVSLANSTTLSYSYDDTNDGAFFTNWTIPTLQVGTWHHVTMVILSNNTVTAYLDGKSYGNQSGPHNNWTSTQFNLGRSYDTNFTGPYFYLNGFLDNTQIYPYARTSAQILQDYNAGKAKAAAADGIAVNLGAPQGAQSGSVSSLSDGLVGYWNFDNGSGTTAADLSGNNNTGTLGSGSSAPGWYSGKYGIGISFPGTQTYIDSGSATSLNPTSQITLSAWISFSTQPDATGNPNAIDKWDWPNNKRSWFLGTEGGKIAASISRDGSFVNRLGYTDPTTITLNTWQHLAMTYDGQNMVIYKNGQKLNTQSYNQPYTIYSNNLTSVLLGRSRGVEGSIRFFNGLVDEVRIYNRALSTNEVAQLYEWAPSPIAHWKFNEGAGTSAFDSSSNSYNATFGAGSSSPTWYNGKYGNGLSFDGNDYASISGLPSIPRYTVEAWFKTNHSDGSYHSILRNPYNAVGCNYALFVRNGKVVTYDTISARYELASTTSVSNNKWHFVTSTFDGSNLKLFVDGVQETSVGDTGTPSAGGSLWIGNDNWSSNSFYGSIDEIKIYNYARTPGQILSDMSAGRQNQIIAHYDFDEGFGTTIYNRGSIGSTLNGILGPGTSAPSWTDNGKFGKALSFDGNNDYVSIGPTITTQAISLWFKPSSTNPSVIDFDNGTHYIFGAGATLLAVGFSSPTTYVNGIISNTITADTWQHLVVSTDAVFSSTAIKIGKASSGYFSGLMDDVKIYNYALTTDEVKLDYNRGVATQLGSLSSGSGNTAPATASSQEYCVPGDTATCSPPIVKWTFNEGSGTTAFDSSGNNHHASVPSTGWNSQGKFGNSKKINGSLVTASSPDLSPASFTLNFWLYKENDTTGWSYIGKGNVDASLEYTFESAASGSFWVRLVGTSFTQSGSFNYTPKKWHFLSLLYDNDAKKAKVFHNGQLIFDKTANVSISSTGHVFGAYNVTQYRSIDNLTFYNYARTPAQIAWDYNKGAPTFWADFDECQGATIHDRMGTGATGTTTIGAGGSQVSLGTCAIGDTSAWGVGSTGKINSALSFDGTDDYVNIGTGASNVYSVSLWFKPSTTSPNLIDLDNGTHYLLGSGATLSAVGFSSPTIYINGTTATTTYSPNTWNHVTVTTATSFNASAITIAKRATNYFPGLIDDVKIFNYPLTSKQVKTLYNDGSVSFR